MVLVSRYGERTSRTSTSSRGRRYSPWIRSGCLSSFDPRSSTKAVRIGAGRASFDSTQSVNAWPGAVALACSGAAKTGARLHAISTSISSAIAGVAGVVAGRQSGMACIVVGSPKS